MAKKVTQVLQNYKRLQAEKAPLNPTLQEISEFVSYGSKDFISNINKSGMQQVNPQSFKLSDGSAVKAKRAMDSSIIGAMWPNGAKSLQLLPPVRMLELGLVTEEVKKYYETTTKRVASFMDNPKAGFMTTLEEFMSELSSFGISGIGSFRNETEKGPDYDNPLTFKVFDAQSMYIDEDSNGMVDTIYYTKTFSAKDLIATYGLENVSKKARDEFMKGENKNRYEVLVTLEKRLEIDPNKYGEKAKPICSLHIEVEAKKILKESGFDELPISVSRFSKTAHSKYGHSPAMAALPDIREINQHRVDFMLANALRIKPPLRLFDDGSLGGGVLDISPNSVVVFSASSRLSGALSVEPLAPLFTVGEVDMTVQRIAELEQSIAEHFYVDRLLDLNNETQMTLGEANMRWKLRGELINTIYNRQYTELFTPLIERVINILFSMHLLGVVEGSETDLKMQEKKQDPYYIPPVVAQWMAEGKEAFRINFISPASRVLNTDELTGLTQFVELLTPVAQLNPEVLDNVNFDELSRKLRELTGAPSELVEAPDAVEMKRQQRQQMMQAQMAAQAAQVGAQVDKDSAMAEQMRGQTTNG